MKFKPNKSSAGFSVIEILLVLGITGIVTAIAVPGLFQNLSLQRLNNANNGVAEMIKQAQNEASRRKGVWQASFRVQGNQLQGAVHSRNTPLGSLTWTSLEKDVTVESGNTTLPYDFVSRSWRVRFNYNGTVAGPTEMGRITLRHNITGNNRRCVRVTTLIGGLRQEFDNDCTLAP